MICGLLPFSVSCGNVVGHSNGCLPKIGVPLYIYSTIWVMLTSLYSIVLHCVLIGAGWSLLSFHLLQFACSSPVVGSKGITLHPKP